VSLKSWLRNNFVAGVLVVVPLLGTVALFSWLLGTVTDPGLKWLQKHFDKYQVFFEKKTLVLLFRLVVLFAMLGLIVLVGALARNFLGRRVIHFGDTLLDKIPMVKRVYRAFKQIAGAFWGQSKTVFGRVVAVEYPRAGIYTLGFVMSWTRADTMLRRGERLTSVFLPATPNFTVGWFVLVPDEDVIPLDVKTEDAMKMIISGGAVVPPHGQWLTILESRQKTVGNSARAASLAAAESLSSGTM